MTGRHWLPRQTDAGTTPPTGLRRWAAWARSRRARLPLAIIAAGVAVSVLLAVLALLNSPTVPPTPPRPPAAALPASPSKPGAPARATPCSVPRTPQPGDNTPYRVCVPAIGVNAAVMRLGLNSDRTVQVPPLSRVRDAGWYRYSAPPGVSGPTVILGHIDSAEYGDGVFYHLGQLRSGDQIRVVRADARVATYRITSVVEVPKSQFPTDAVYGPASGPAIRLVTCGGRFDASSRSYVDNIIVYGIMLSLH